MALGTNPAQPGKPSVFSQIPWWGWVAGLGVLVVIFLVMRSSSSSNSSGVVSPGASSDNTQQLSDLESSLQQLLAQSGNSSSGNSGLGGGSAGDGLTSAGGNDAGYTDPGIVNWSPAGQPLQVAPASPAATNTAKNFGPSTRYVKPSVVTQPSTAPVITNPTPAQAAIAPAPATPSQSGSQQAQMQSNIAVYQNIVAQGGTLNARQAAALKTDIATYEAQYGALSGSSQPVMVKSTVNATPGEPIAPSLIQGGATGDASQAASRLKTIGISTTTAPSNPTPTVTASKTSSTSFVQQTGGNVKKAV